MSYTLAYTGAEIDALLGKIDAIFVAEYGSTIYSEVTAAIAAGNKVIVANAGKVYVYAGQDDNSGYVFTQSGPNAAKPNATYVTLSTGDVWSTATVDLATLQQFYDSFMTDTASGSIASFPDGAQNVPVTELTADIEPIQDLHGQASPYPPNGGKNKLGTLLASIKSLNTSGTWSGDSYTLNGVTFACKSQDGYLTSFTVNGTASANTYFIIADENTWTVLPAGAYTISGCPSGGSDTTYCIVAQFNDGSSQRTTYDTGSSGTITATTDLSLVGNRRFNFFVASGVAVSNKECKPMVCLSSATDPTVFDPYSNICPIEGYTGAEITRTGKNLFGATLAQGSFLPTTGEESPSTTRVRSTAITLKAGTYTISANGISGVAMYVYDTENTWISGESITNWQNNPYTFTLTSLRNVRFVFQNNNATITASDVTSVMLEVGSTAHTYTDYNPDSTVYPISWSDEAGTVYGGNINATEGDLEDNKGRTDLGGLNWSLSSSGYFYAYFPNPDPTVIPMCEILKGTTEADVITTHSTNALIALTSSGNVIAYAPQYATAADFKTAMTGYYVVWQRKAADIVSYSIAPTEVTTLLGDNNIFSSTGDVDVRYRCNTALYIEKMLSGNTQQALSMSPRQQTQELNVPTLGKTISTDIGSFEAEHPELDELTEEPELEPYDEPEEEQPEELTEDEPEAEAEPEEELTEELEAEPEEEPAEAPEEA